MFSITGYVFDGSKFRGRTMIPQMSVFPSRPLAAKTSGGRKPAATSLETSAFSSSATTEPSLVRRSCETLGRSIRDQVST